MKPGFTVTGKRCGTSSNASPTPARFLDQAVEPFQPAALHPGRGHRLDAGVEIERRPDAQLHRPDRVAVVVGEQVLLRAAEADEHQSGAAGVDPLDDSPILL